MEENYVENGAFYITTRIQLLNSKLRYSGKIGVVEMPFSRSFQIDTEEDFVQIKGNIILGNRLHINNRYLTSFSRTKKDKVEQIKKFIINRSIYSKTS